MYPHVYLFWIIRYDNYKSVLMYIYFGSYVTIIIKVKTEDRK
jgi:hypothetical protein